MSDVHDGAVAIRLDVAAHAHALALEAQRINAGVAEQFQRLTAQPQREGSVPVAAEIEEDAASGLGALLDTALHQLELAGVLRRLFGLADRIVGIGPEAALGVARLALQRVHLASESAVVGEGVDPRHAAPQQLAL